MDFNKIKLFINTVIHLRAIQIYYRFYYFLRNRLFRYNVKKRIIHDFYSIVWKNLILPSFVLGIRPLAVIIQLMRSNLLEVLSQDYIRTAYSKGLSKYKVIFNHGLKNSLNPVITAVSGWFASLLSGAIFVEYIFGWKGLGKEIVEALNQLDIPVVMGAVLVIALLFIIINIVVDFIYAYLDPRIKTI